MKSKAMPEWCACFTLQGRCGGRTGAGLYLLGAEGVPAAADSGQLCNRRFFSLIAYVSGLVVRVLCLSILCLPCNELQPLQGCFDSAATLEPIFWQKVLTAVPSAVPSVPSAPPAVESWVSSVVLEHNCNDAREHLKRCSFLQGSLP